MNPQQHADQQPTAMTDTHRKPFVHLAYRKIMIDHLLLRDLSRRVKAAEAVLGAPVRVFFSGMARDRHDTLHDLTHGWYELKVQQHASQPYFPPLAPAHTPMIPPHH